jgi:plastocyanin
MSMRSPHRRALIAASLFVLVLVAGACSDNTDVGSGVGDVKGSGSGKLSLGAETTTTTAAVATTAAPPPTTAKPAATTAPPTTAPPTTVAPTTTAPQDTSFKISINGDNTTSSQFDPSNAAVAVGTVVKFINNDSVPRSIVANDGSFRSPEIAPGSSWSYKAAKPGVFDYQDGTRPYAVGRLEVR